MLADRVMWGEEGSEFQARHLFLSGLLLLLIELFGTLRAEMAQGNRGRAWRPVRLGAMRAADGSPDVSGCARRSPCPGTRPPAKKPRPEWALQAASALPALVPVIFGHSRRRGDLDSVKRLHRLRDRETFSGAGEAIFLFHEEGRKRTPVTNLPNDLTKGESVMWTLISLFYRGYCRARLAEMRKYHLATIA
jgi:hypothetical protein